MRKLDGRPGVKKGVKGDRKRVPRKPEPEKKNLGRGPKAPRGLRPDFKVYWIEGKPGKTWTSTGWRFQLRKRFKKYILTDLARKGKQKTYSSLEDATAAAEDIINAEGTW
jgi:hypothetical protein